MSVADQPHSEKVIRALLLWNLELVDTRTRGMNRSQALAMLAPDLGLKDEQAVAKAVDRVLNRGLSLLEIIESLCGDFFERRHGLPVMRHDMAARRLFRAVDPDALVPFCADFHLRPHDPMDWPAVPLDQGSRLADLAGKEDIDTHIHLGGALPPLFFWVPLMGGGLSLRQLRGISLPQRFHAPYEDWCAALIRAAWTRLWLAAQVMHCPTIRDEFRPFAHLDQALWQDERLCAPSPPQGIPLFEITGLVALAPEATFFADNPIKDWPFPDPLRSPASQAVKVHYAEGERRLLYCLAQLLQRRHLLPPDRIAAILAALEDYLKLRHSFHRWQLHDHGSAGLLRFVASFGMRRFYLGRRTRSKKQKRMRNRIRRARIKLERSRMFAALDAQLHEPYSLRRRDRHLRNARLTVQPAGENAALTVADHQGLLGTIGSRPQGLEMRVTLPSRGSFAIHQLRAWLGGIQDFLHANGFASAHRPKVGLLVHAIKGAKGPPAAERHARQLFGLLCSYPGLRPYLIGFDAAGLERGNPPRQYAPAFHQLQQSCALFRPEAGAPRIHLGYTYHVGEDCDDLLTGLRHIDEVASLILPSTDGGRLGHALALGEDPKRFYQIHGETEPDGRSHLLDLVWAHGRLLYAEDGDLSRKQRHVVTRMCLQLEKRILDLVPGATVPSIGECFRNMNLDRKSGIDFCSEGELIAILKSDADSNTAGNPVTVAVQADKDWRRMLRMLQSLLGKRLARCRLCIEVNPTSNLIIGDYCGYAELPYAALEKAHLAFSLNTDDPGLFMTSLPGERAAMYAAMEGIVPHRDILHWLADRAFDARQSTFLGAPMPLGPNLKASEALLDEIFLSRLPG